MKYTPKKEAVLLLEDGTVFKGKAAGKIGTTTGELCFNTGMTGYQEIFTDPSYFGQIMLSTNVHVGNYGVHRDEIESDRMKISGLVCKYFSTQYSRPDGYASLEEYFVLQNMVAISDVDTRAVVRHIRDKGAMNAIISSENTDIEFLKKELAKVPSMAGLELSSKVSTQTAYTSGNENASYRVALLDLGVKKNIVRCLTDRDCYVKVFPMNSTLNDLMEFSPDGFMISNGPGDPGVMHDTVKLVSAILNTRIPVFGICLGHQIIAECNGVRTYKMHNGHRGINHPIKNLITGKCEVTSQNHGFGVVEEDVRKNPDLEVTHINLNDNTIEGIRMKTKKVFTVQYHPEASPGPHDARYLFDDFISNIKEFKATEVDIQN
jgi:carbamoyl-phosphate synthase small subunit